MCLPSSRTCTTCTTGAEPPHSFEGRPAVLDGELSVAASGRNALTPGVVAARPRSPGSLQSFASRGALLCRDLVEPLADVAKPRDKPWQCGRNPRRCSRAKRRSAARTRGARAARSAVLDHLRARIGSAGSEGVALRLQRLLRTERTLPPSEGGARLKHLAEPADGSSVPTARLAHVFGVETLPKDLWQGACGLNSVSQTPQRIGPRAAAAVETRMRGHPLHTADRAGV